MRGRLRGGLLELNALMGLGCIGDTQHCNQPCKTETMARAGGQRRVPHALGQNEYNITLQTAGAQVGNDVYLVRTDDPDALPDDTALDLCATCGKGHRPETILECERCLGGYHMACLRPAVKKIPEVRAGGAPGGVPHGVPEAGS